MNRLQKPICSNRAAPKSRFQSVQFPLLVWLAFCAGAGGSASQEVEAEGMVFPGAAGADGMVIVRNGCIIWRGPSADNKHRLHSVTKIYARGGQRVCPSLQPAQASVQRA
jgi:hypothetical protein